MLGYSFTLSFFIFHSYNFHVLVSIYPINVIVHVYITLTVSQCEIYHLLTMQNSFKKVSTLHVLC